jgi:hypothetical protein
MPTQPNFTISLETAQDRINNWKNDQNAIKATLEQTSSPMQNSVALSINAFSFKLRDLSELFERIYAYNNNGQAPDIHLSDHIAGMQNPIDAVRFYVGEDVDAAGNAQVCLVGVSVVGFNAAGTQDGGSDFVNLPVINQQPASETSIYDFSYPCPTTCPNPPSSGINNVNFNG